MPKPLTPEKELNAAQSSDSDQTQPPITNLHAKNSSIRYSTAVTVEATVAVIAYYFRFIGHPDGTIVYPKAASCLEDPSPWRHSLRDGLLAPGFGVPSSV